MGQTKAIHSRAGEPGSVPGGWRKGRGQGRAGEAHSLGKGPEAGVQGHMLTTHPSGEISMLGVEACLGDRRKGEGQAEGTPQERSLE